MSTSKASKPLPRGSACQECNRRKIRCGAEKPTCANCIRRRKHCAYLGPDGFSNGASSSRGAQPQYTTNEGSAAVSGADRHDSAASGSTALPTSTPWITPTAGPSHFALPSTTPTLYSMEPPMLPNGTPQFGSGLQDGATAILPDTDIQPFLSQLSGFFSVPGKPSEPDLPVNWNDLDFSWLLNEDPASANSSSPLKPTGESGTELPSYTGMIGQAGQTSQNIVSMDASAEEHLIWLFFANQATFGLEMHIPTFYARLRDPDPNRQPHPCLLNAMYLLTCPASPSPIIRGQQQHYFTLARQWLDEAILVGSRMLDAMRAATLLSPWLFGQLRYREAWVMTGIAVRIAISGSFDRIKGSIWVPENPPIETESKQGGPQWRGWWDWITPPQSQIELGEWIYAFWAIYVVDTCASTVMAWSTGFDLNRVITPLPRPWSEYENPSLLESELGLRKRGSPESYTSMTDSACFIRALTILRKATDIRGYGFMSNKHHSNMFLRSEARSQGSTPNSEWMDPSSPHSNRSIPRDAVMQAIRRFRSSLPPDLTAVTKTDEGHTMNARAAALQFIVGAAELTLITDRAARPSAEVLGLTRRLVGIIQLLQDKEIGEFGAFICSIWGSMARIIIRELKHLKQENDVISDAVLRVDLQTIRRALLTREPSSPYMAHIAEGIPMWEHMIFTDQEMASADPSPGFEPEDGPMVDFS